MAKRMCYTLYVNRNGDYTIGWISQRIWRTYYAYDENGNCKYSCVDTPAPTDPKFAVRRTVLGKQYSYDPDKHLFLLKYVYTYDEAARILARLHEKSPFPYENVEPARVGILTDKYFKLFCELYKRDLLQLDEEGLLTKKPYDIYQDFITRYNKWYDENQSYEYYKKTLERIKMQIEKLKTDDAF